VRSEGKTGQNLWNQVPSSSILTVIEWRCCVMHTLGFEDFHKLFNESLAMADRVPEHRETLLEIAEAFLVLANDCIQDDSAEQPHQNAPTIAMTQ
jgi:hypothetical protein